MLRAFLVLCVVHEYTCICIKYVNRPVEDLCAKIFLKKVNAQNYLAVLKPSHTAMPIRHTSLRRTFILILKIRNVGGVN